MRRQGIINDEYTKRQCIAFAEWVNKNYWWQDDVGNWVVSENDSIPAHSSEQLYDLFLLHQQQ